LTDIFAHRGSAQKARETTLDAFIAARELGADGVELDVHLTADGCVVVHHDADLPGKGPIASLSRSQLPGWLPELEQAFEACRPLAVNVEIKADPEIPGDQHQLVARLAAMLASRPEEGRIVVSSFSLAALDAFSALAPGLSTGLLVEPTDDPVTALRAASDHGHGGLHPFFLAVDEALVEAANAFELAIRPWTVDDPAQITRLAGLGVDAVITNDVPAALRAVGRC
jgi:glycerophosphoryl diester phosphodiesterase